MDMKWTCGLLVCLEKEFKSVVQHPVLLSPATMVVPASLALLCGHASAQKGEIKLWIIEIAA